jgi:hypothetical protein
MSIKLGELFNQRHDGMKQKKNQQIVYPHISLLYIRLQKQNQKKKLFELIIIIAFKRKSYSHILKIYHLISEQGKKKKKNSHKI